MRPRPSVSDPWQIAAKRLVVCSRSVCLSLLAIVAFGLLPRIQAAEKILSDRQVSTAPTKTQAEQVPNYGKLPLSFEANQGQVSGAVQFLSRGLGYTLFLTGDEAVLSLGKAAGVADGGLTSVATSLLDKPTTDNGPGATESVLRMKLVGASASAAATGAEELPGKSNYFIGNDPTKWRTNVPNYAKVRYQNVYPGVDLVYYGSQGGLLEYDFVVAPGADPHAIGLSFQGAGKIRVDKGTGDLVLALAGSELRFRKPVVYQEVPSELRGPRSEVQDEARNSSNRQSTIGNRQFVDARFVLTGRNQIGFQIAAYDRRAPLIIDPVLIYSTYLGGGQYNVGYRVAVDASGSAYVAGATNSSDFPTTAGVYKSALNAGGCAIRINPGQPKKTFTCPDAFVTKLDPTGTQLVYSTYLGGSASDGATGISVDSSFNAYVTGATGSTNFPTTSGAFQTSATDSSARTHAFATKLNPTGSALIYSTYLAGTHDDFSTISALDSSGYLYVAGGTISKDFPTTTGAFQRTIAGNSCHNYEQTWPCFDGFIAKLNLTGSGLIYSTYLGGSDHDVVLGLAVDSTGSAYVTGGTASNNFPTANALQSSSGTAPCGSTPGGNPRPCFFHAFVTKLNSTGTALDYSTYLGGNGHDAGLGIAVDDTDAAYVAGTTNSTNFPTTTGAAQASLGGGTCGKKPSNTFDCPDAFVAKLEPSGTSLAYSTYLGGNSFDFGMGIAVDSAYNAYVVGGTDSLDFPTDANTGNFQGGTCSIPTTGIFQTSNDISGYSFNCPNAFLTEVDPTGSTLLFSTYLGGASGDFAFSVAVDGLGGTYVAGSTLSSNFPTLSAYQPSMTGYADAFITKFASPPGVNFSAPTLPFGSQSVGTTSGPQTETVTNNGAANLTISMVTIGGTNASDFANSADTCTGATVTPNNTCTVSVTFTPSGTGSRSASLDFTDNASSSPQTVNLTGTGTAGTVSLSTTSVNFGNQPLGTTSAASAVTVTNSGAASLTFTSIAATGDFAVAVSGTTCSTSTPLAASGNCVINVTFTPTATGSRSGSLTLADNATGSTQTVGLSGTGTQAAVSLSSPLTFSAQLVGTTSSSQTVTLTNTGSTNLTFTAIAATAPFAVASSGTTCSTSTPVAAAATCTVAVTFTPTAAGTATGSLSFSDNAPGSPQTLALSGTGQDFTFAPPSGSSTSASVAPGSPASYTLSVGGEGGLTGTVNFTCTGAPSEATCTVSPNPATAGSTATNVTVNVTTTAPSISVPRSRPLPPAPPLSPGLRGLLMLALVLAAMAWAIKRRNQPGVSRWRSTVVPISAGLLLMLAIAGCGGGGGGGGGTTSNPGTPAGTYTLTVTGTAGSGSSTVSHTVSLTLIVS